MAANEHKVSFMRCTFTLMSPPYKCAADLVKDLLRCAILSCEWEAFHSK